MLSSATISVQITTAKTFVTYQLLLLQGLLMRGGEIYL